MRFVLPLLALAAAASAALLPAHAQSIDTRLYLDPLPSGAAAGDTIEFFGWLESEGGYAVPYATIYVKDDVRFGSDETMASVVTGEDGVFLAEWVAVPGPAGGAWDFYAVFEGDADLRRSRSDTFSVSVARDPAPRSDPPPTLPRPALLALDPVLASAAEGSMLTFSGRLVSDGLPVPGAIVEIKEDDPLLPDDVIAYARTGADGRFSVAWGAEQGLVEKVLEIYAEYDGDGTYGHATTRRQQIEILPAPVAATSITLDALPRSAYAGDEVEFTGRLSSGGLPLAGAAVAVYEDDPLSPDQRIGGGLTGADGGFAIPWTASAGLFEADFDLYAEFAGGGGYGGSQTQRQQMAVLKYGGDIRLDPLPRGAAAGDLVMFRGALDLELHSPEGAKVYIMDEDPLNPDDLLAAAYVEADGRFAANWFASRMDADSEVDVYAVFEGGDLFYRQTTCDEGPTHDFGGSCIGTVQLEVRDAPRGPPAGGGGRGDGGGDAYMEMYYSMDLDGPPLVAIVPGPDRPGDSMRYIVPAQEGILTWTSSMERRYGGDWDVTFAVVEAGEPFFGGRPDVVVNLASPEKDAGCLDEYAGWAQVSGDPQRPAPVQTAVCTAGQWGPVTKADAAATAAHEFIHAMGLGHAFNKPGDLMCSIEQGLPTCAAIASEETAPSDLNAAAVAEMYGTDGFANPNNPVPYKSRLYDVGAARAPSDPGWGEDRMPPASTRHGQPGAAGSGGGTVAIPEWIRASAGWWAGGLISDEEFAGGIGYLIRSGTISIPSGSAGAGGAGPEQVAIPEWIRASAGWWADGLISDEEFAGGIAYLVSIGAITA